MTILKTEETIELDFFVEENVIGVDLPYYVSRVKYSDGRIVWFGLNTNWKKNKNQWKILKGCAFEECEIPEYEKIYQKTIAASEDNLA
jgi:hypothetical protein